MSIRLTSSQLGDKIKSLLDEGKTNKEIIDETNICQSQLTNYKRVIVLGKLDELKQGKPLNDIIKENKGIKIKRGKTKEEHVSEDIDRNLAKRVKNEEDKIRLNKEMRSRIEYIQTHGLEEHRYEYFRNGKWQVFVPILSGIREKETYWEHTLHLQNHILRVELQRGLEQVEESFRLRIKKLKRDIDTQKRRNGELNAQLSSLIFSEGKTLDECLVQTQKEIAQLKKELSEAKRIRENEIEERVQNETAEYKQELEHKDLEIKELKKMLQKCETERRSAVHRNTKKYLKSVAVIWEKSFLQLNEEYKKLVNKNYQNNNRRKSV